MDQPTEHTPAETHVDQPMVSPRNEAPGKPAAPATQLTDLRAKILTDLGPLAEKLADPVERFDLLLVLARSEGKTEYFSKAYEAARLIEIDSEKASALRDLLFEINFRSANVTP